MREQALGEMMKASFEGPISKINEGMHNYCQGKKKKRHETK